MCKHVCEIGDNTSPPPPHISCHLDNGRNWLIIVCYHHEKIKGEGMCHNGPLLKRPPTPTPPFFSFFFFNLHSTSFLFVCAAASCHDDDGEGLCIIVRCFKDDQWPEALNWRLRAQLEPSVSRVLCWGTVTATDKPVCSSFSQSKDGKKSL